MKGSVTIIAVLLVLAIVGGALVIYNDNKETEIHSEKIMLDSAGNQVLVDPNKPAFMEGGDFDIICDKTVYNYFDEGLFTVILQIKKIIQ